MILKELEDEQYELAQSLTVMDILIPKGFVTDLMSVPGIVRWFVPKWGWSTMASILHDFGYRRNTPKMPRKFWDHKLMETLLMARAPAWRAVIIYLAVRLFGWYTWNKIRNEKGE